MASHTQAEDRGQALTRADFLRRVALAGLSAGLLADSLVACSAATFEPSGSTLPPTPTPSPTGAVNLLAPSGGIAPVVLKAFSKRTGVAVHPIAFAGEAALPAALHGEPSADVVLAPDRSVPVLARERQLLPLDMRLVDNFDYVQGAFRAPPYDHGDPARYSVPYQFSTLGLAVSLDALGGTPRRWSDLWRPGLRGRVLFEVRGPSVIGVGLLSLGFPLGSGSRREIALAVKRLIDLKPNLLPASSSLQDAPVIACWSHQALSEIKDGSWGRRRFVLPADGFEIATDTLCVSAASGNLLAAHALLDYCLEPGVQRRLSEGLGTQSAEPEAWQYLPPLERSFARSDLQLAHGQWLGDLGSFRAVYDRAWTAVARAWGLAA